MKIFLDTYGLIKIAEGDKVYEKHLDEDVAILRDNLAELYYYLLREHDIHLASFFCELFSRLVVDFPMELVSESMKFRLEQKKKKFSYIDCFGYVYALKKDYLFVTGDRAFKDMKNVELLR